MKKPHVLSLVLSTAIMILCLDACKTEETMFEEPQIPVTGESGNNSPSNGVSDRTENYFTAQSTVADVINHPAFGDFGRLLFPVDRNVPQSMTLAQVSASSVYMWYPNIRADKTVEILNYLYSQAANGTTIFYRIYSDDASEHDRTD